MAEALRSVHVQQLLQTARYIRTMRNSYNFEFITLF